MGWAWALVAVVGFAVEIALVIAMARGNTARWERDHRAAQAAVRARHEESLRLRAAAVVARVPRVQHRPLPHLHVPQVHLPHLHLPHLHLPSGVVARLPHPHLRGVLHLPHRNGRPAAPAEDAAPGPEPDAVSPAEAPTPEQAAP
ncbi:hypothetical protein JOD57_004641 [Geodermatophilus bullaregiensis]|uniref:hypothetical protein n=1 Tax=Geodermatophilus bullaregiensis TaxID=1564160 RepID=UPI00195CC935|nr:hypothetical protein [Geodermatophilus bullaregiensis]MBM7808804.1 hypothetical protein [Geodermatophilus bullaregiensis]